MLKNGSGFLFFEQFTVYIFWDKSNWSSDWHDPGNLLKLPGGTRKLQTFNFCFPTFLVSVVFWKKQVFGSFVLLHHCNKKLHHMIQNIQISCWRSLISIDILERTCWTVWFACVSVFEGQPKRASYVGRPLIRMWSREFVGNSTRVKVVWNVFLWD